MNLSKRLRPDVECAPWVIEGVKELEAEIARVQSLHEGLMKNADKMNDELRAEIAALKAAKIADLDSAAESLWKK